MISGTGGPNLEAPGNGNRAGLTAFRLGWTLFLVFATAAPYLWNYLATPPGGQYTWILPPYPEDSFGYLAWTRQAAEGHFLFQLKFTALPHSAFLFNPFFLMAGWLTRLFAGNAGLALFVLKEVGVVCFLLALYKYIDHLGFNRFQSVVATILVGVSSGVGGLLVWLGLADPASHVSGDLWLVDMNTFWSLLWNPLFPWSLTLLLLAMFWLGRGSRDGRKSDFWLAGVAAGILALIHPYSQPLLFTFAVLITFWRAKASALGCLFRFFAAALPFVVYIGSVTAFHPLISRHDTMGEMSSPSPAAYALGFGLPLLFCALGLAVDRQRLLKHCGPVLFWFVLSLTLAYVPFWFQRKLIFGAHVPLCLMAAVALDLLRDRFSNSGARRWLAAAGALILLPLLVSTPVYLLAAENREVRGNADGYYYVSRDMRDGLDYLKNRTTGRRRLCPRRNQPPHPRPGGKHGVMGPLGHVRGFGRTPDVDHEPLQSPCRLERSRPGVRILEHKHPIPFRGRPAQAIPRARPFPMAGHPQRRGPGVHQPVGRHLPAPGRGMRERLNAEC